MTLRLKSNVAPLSFSIAFEVLLRNGGLNAALNKKVSCRTNELKGGHTLWYDNQSGQLGFVKGRGARLMGMCTRFT